MSGLPILERGLAEFFGRSSRRPAPGRYVAIRGEVRAPIRKVGKLWRVELPDRALSNSLLGDLKRQLADLGFDILGDQS